MTLNSKEEQSSLISELEYICVCVCVCDTRAEHHFNYLGERISLAYASASSGQVGDQHCVAYHMDMPCTQ